MSAVRAAGLAVGKVWTRFTSAVAERRLIRGIRRRLHESWAGTEPQLRRALNLKDIQIDRFPFISLHGDFTSLEESRLLWKAFDAAMGDADGLSSFVRQIGGMSGQKYRTLINSLVRHHPDARYLEVGSWAGSTAASAMCGNSLSILCIDNWSQFGGPKKAFFENIERVRTPSVDFMFLERDFRQVDYQSLGPYNIYLFDGPHEEHDQYDGIMLVRPALDKRVIIVVDDWNWIRVRTGALRAIRDVGYNIESSIEIRTADDDWHAEVSGTASDWHNGYFLAVCTAR